MENKNRTLVIVLVIIIVLLMLGNFGYGMMGFRSGMMGGYYGEFILLNWIINILMIILIIFGIYWLIKHIGYDGKDITYNGKKIG
jgi:uncharacterized membrane protein